MAVMIAVVIMAVVVVIIPAATMVAAVVRMALVTVSVIIIVVGDRIANQSRGSDSGDGQSGINGLLWAAVGVVGCGAT